MSHSAPKREYLTLLRMAAAVVIAFGFDRLSKILIVHWLGLASLGRIEVQPPYLVLQMAWNKGINFGLFTTDGGPWVLVASTIFISCALTIWVRNKSGWIPPLAVGSIVGGALGNAFDRALYGAVADYLNMSCCGVRNPFSFNVADVFIFGGVLLLIVGISKSSQPVMPAA